MSGLRGSSERGMHAWWHRWGDNYCDPRRWHVAISTWGDEECYLYARSWAVIDDFGNLVTVK